MQFYNIDYISWHTEHDGIAECDLSDTSMSRWFWHHGGRRDKTTALNWYYHQATMAYDGLGFNYKKTQWRRVISKRQILLVKHQKNLK